MSKCIYLIGSLRNPAIPELANKLEDSAGMEVFSSWFSPGPRADDHWKEYAQARGWSYLEALQEYAATHVFEFDKHHIDRADIGVLVAPAGKSCHLELGYMIGRGKPCFYLLEEDNERWDLMLQFCNLNGGAVCSNVDMLIKKLKEVSNATPVKEVSKVCLSDDVHVVYPPWPTFPQYAQLLEHVDTAKLGDSTPLASFMAYSALVAGMYGFWGVQEADLIVEQVNKKFQTDYLLPSMHIADAARKHHDSRKFG